MSWGPPWCARPSPRPRPWARPTPPAWPWATGQGWTTCGPTGDWAGGGSPRWAPSNESASTRRGSAPWPRPSTEARPAGVASPGRGGKPRAGWQVPAGVAGPGRARTCHPGHGYWTTGATARQALQVCGGLLVDGAFAQPHVQDLAPIPGEDGQRDHLAGLVGLHRLGQGGRGGDGLAVHRRDLVPCLDAGSSRAAARVNRFDHHARLGRAQRADAKATEAERPEPKGVVGELRAGHCLDPEERRPAIDEVGHVLVGLDLPG